MLARSQALYHAALARVRRERLRRRELGALRRAGEAVADSATLPGGPGARRLAEEIGAGRRRIEELAERRQASVVADQADMAAVSAWMRPVVALRGTCTRLVLTHRQSLESRALRPRYEALGRAARLAPAAGEGTAPSAPSATAPPAWSATVVKEATGFGRAVGVQLRSNFIPKAPALAGLAVGWWVANTYTDSHLRSTLRSIGIGSGGTRVVSSSTYDAMQLWLPLLAAALCAYLGERIAAWYRAERREG